MCTGPKRWTIRNRRFNAPCSAPAEYSATLFQQNILLGEAGDVIRSMMSCPAEYSVFLEQTSHVVLPLISQD